MGTRAKKVGRSRTPVVPDPTHGLRSKDDITYWLVLRFQQLLSDGVLKPGTRLPSERELAVKFGVARSSLRQALKVLEVMGVITQRVGDGSYLNNDASAVLSVPMDFLFLLDDTSVQELVEMRLIVEPALAARAAERATAADIALLKQAIEEFERSEGDRVKLVSADLLFHRRIFQASGNRLSGRLFHMIHRAMLNMMMVTSRMVDLEHTLRFHIPIMGAIKHREPKQASRLMTEHLVDAQELILHTKRETQAKQLEDYFSGTSVMKKRK
ncbi:MAG TPA: FadR/GntR family transcriptional regulator [Terriglobales bacterium]|jgi:GntR family transcriptional repressor for pyruvate dehydrogenase complex